MLRSRTSSLLHHAPLRPTLFVKTPRTELRRWFPSPPLVWIPPGYDDGYDTYMPDHNDHREFVVDRIVSTGLAEDIHGALVWIWASG